MDSSFRFLFPLIGLLLSSCAGGNPVSSESPAEPSSSQEELPSSKEESSKESSSAEEDKDSSLSSDEQEPSSSSEEPEPSSSSKEELQRLEIVFGDVSYSGSDTFDADCYEVLGGEASLASVASCFSSGKGSAVRVGSNKNIGHLGFSFQEPLSLRSVSVYSFRYGNASYSFSLECAGKSFDSPVLSNAELEAEPAFLLSLDEEVSSLTIRGASRFNLSRLVFEIGSSELPVPSSSESSSFEETSSSEESSSREESSLPVEGLDPYYDTVDFTLTGAALKSALSTRISSPYVDKGYDFAYEAYLSTDVGENGKIIDMYSSCSFDPESDHQGAPGKGNYNAEGQMFNREHTIPQSVFSSRAPMKSDLHHLLPTDAYVNNRRSNYPHGYVNSPVYTSTNGTIVGSSAASKNHGYSGNACEVPDQYKGDIARIYFYFVTRYQNNLSSWGDYAAFSKNTYPSLSSWAIETYLEWNDRDPISEKERKRNEAVASFQGNRNPFVDVPGLGHRIWDECL